MSPESLPETIPETIPTEEIALADGLGRVLAAPVRARLTQPPFNAAAMDGYAIRRADQNQPLRVIGEAAAGRPWDGTAEPGTAVRIFTGATVPGGYDCVVMQEDTDCGAQGDTVVALDVVGMPVVVARDEHGVG